ncbi:hypothetical protein DY000_02046102 [Brassica cretica]|uniref:J domain-containing protein n=1 Tax=Brassica cretica TaxID=69181 RepID=A0ABQ7EYP8_BRACR|nr:hypothetical protein DY000_02046102 [Brassica cretica]
MNNRDHQSRIEQEQRTRISETADAEIKRWATGKEGNMRALLSSLQIVLWPGCGWEAVSLTDLITSSAVKKVYRKATLYVHPDKVQQKGATLEQKKLGTSSTKRSSRKPIYVSDLVSPRVLRFRFENSFLPVELESGQSTSSNG